MNELLVAGTLPSALEHLPARPSEGGSQAYSSKAVLCSEHKRLAPSPNRTTAIGNAEKVVLGLSMRIRVNEEGGGSNVQRQMSYGRQYT